MSLTHSKTGKALYANSASHLGIHVQESQKSKILQGLYKWCCEDGQRKDLGEFFVFVCFLSENVTVFCGFLSFLGHFHAFVAKKRAK